MHVRTRNTVVKTKTALAVGAAIYALIGVAYAAYEPRDPAIGANDNVENIDGVSVITIPVLDNDGATVDPSTLQIATNPSKGSVSISNESIIYTPNAGYSGTDSFTYQITEIDWVSTAQPQTVKLNGVTAMTPLASSYDDPGVQGGSSPIHDGQSNQTPGVWNDSPLSSGVVGKSYFPNSTATSLVGCNAQDSAVPAIDLTVVWDATRGTGNATGNMFVITSSEPPTPLGDEGIVLRPNPFSGNELKVNGSDYETLDDGAIGEGGQPWRVRATGHWLGLTPADFESMPVSILASTVNEKTWFVNDTAFTATIDYSGCTLYTATVTVTVSDGFITVEPGSQTDLDEDRDGVPDVVEGADDTDGDGQPDFQDLDSDNDSIVDIVEAGGVDSNADGTVDNPTDANNDGQDDNVVLQNPPDTDSDGVPNFQAVDSNGDGIMDIAETSAADTDANNDGMRDNFVDANEDGLDDTLLGNAVTLSDTDGNGMADYSEVADSSSGGGGGGGALGLLVTSGLVLMSLVGRRRHPFKL